MSKNNWKKHKISNWGKKNSKLYNCIFGRTSRIFFFLPGPKSIVNPAAYLSLLKSRRSMIHPNASHLKIEFLKLNLVLKEKKKNSWRLVGFGILNRVEGGWGCGGKLYIKLETWNWTNVTKFSRLIESPRFFFFFCFKITILRGFRIEERIWKIGVEMLVLVMSFLFSLSFPCLLFPSLFIPSSSLGHRQCGTK